MCRDAGSMLGKQCPMPGSTQCLAFWGSPLHTSLLPRHAASHNTLIPCHLQCGASFCIFFFLYFKCLAHISGKVCCNFTVGNGVAQCGCLSNVLFAEIISPGHIDLSVNQLLHENKKGKKNVKRREKKSLEISQEQNSPLSKWLWGIKPATAHQLYSQPFTTPTRQLGLLDVCSGAAGNKGQMNTR